MTAISSIDDIHVIVLGKNGETYVYAYTNATANQLPKILGKQAVNRELNFDWLDVIKVIRQMPLRECQGK